MFHAAAELWLANAARLSEIDSRFGDGDHGVTISKIANLINDRLDNWPEGENLKDFIAGLGEGVMAVSGGSAGPLYGTMLEGLAGPLDLETNIDGPLLKKMLVSSLAEMKSLTKARIGDKTMMDALIPAVQAAETAEGGVEAIVKAAAEAARLGAEASSNMVSKFGRARSYGGQTIGCVDAGALSTALFFQGLYQGLSNFR